MSDRAFAGLHYLIEAAVERRGEAVALRFGEETLSYRALNARANQCAHYLRELGVGPDVVVGVLMDRSVEMVVGLLAILKAGGAYLPLATDYPAERLGFILRDSGVSTVLTRRESAQALGGFEVNALSLDAEAGLLAGLPADNPEAKTGPRDLAYVIYTSGSTGQPKGCLIEHASICNRLLWMREQYGISEADRILQKTPYTFDVSVWEFFLPLISGATLVLAKPGGHKDNAYLQELIRAEGVTVCHFVPSMLRFFLRQSGVAQCATLRHVFASGEALPYSLMQQCLQTLPARLHNLYGPTETTVDVTWWECAERPDRKVPIGRPISHTEVYVLDENQHPVPAGEAGELFVGGLGVGRGYLNRPDLTRERFIRNPFATEPGARLYRTGDKVRLLPDGEIEYLGRLDFQVKLRGFRIELGEIEATLRSHEGIEDAAVLVRDEAADDPKLVAYLVFRKQPLSTKEVRDFIKRKLPEYMVPNLVVALPAWPMNAHGKLDRAALPWPVSGEPAPGPTTRPADLAVDVNGPSRAQPSSRGGSPPHPAETVFSRLADAEIAADLRGLFQRALGVESLAETGDLFDLGATSFTMVQAVEHIRAQYGVVVPVDVFFDTPTIKDLATYVQQQSGKVTATLKCSTCSAEGETPMAVSPASPPVIRLAAASFKNQAYEQVAPARQFSGQTVPLGALGRLLSVVRCHPERTGPKHLYSSAGGLRAVQAYLFVRENGVAGLAEGFYYYHPQEHRLYPLQTGPRVGAAVFCPFDRKRFANSGFALFLIAQMGAIEPIYGNASPVLALVEAGYMAQALLELPTVHGIGLCPAAGVDFETIRAGFELEPTHRFLHCLLGGMAAEPATESQATGLADFLKTSGLEVHAHCADYRGEKTFAHFLRAEDQWEGLPTIEQKEQLHRDQLHLRRFDREAKAVELEAWEPEAGYFLLRSAKRTYRDEPSAFERFSRFLALLGEDVRQGATRHLYPSVAGTHPLKVYVYLKAGGVENLAEGLYRYDGHRHELEWVTRTLSADLKSCYTPFNRVHFKASKFCLFLVGPTAKLRPMFGEDSAYFALLESGYIGQLLLDRQAEFELGVCPIGGMRYEKIREDFKLEPDDVFLHSFVGGGVAPECAIPWEPLEVVRQTAEAALPEGRSQPASADQAIAIVGISGRYPGAPDMALLERNLREGKSSFTEVRFSGAETYRGGTKVEGAQAKSRHWGGFLEDVDCFDSQLFRITPAEARTLDPQERRFLETAWECLENSGYTGTELNRVAGKVGVFAGAMWDDYQHYHPEEWPPARPDQAVSALHSAIANRVSFFFDFKGPSVAVNTSCSSALTAIHFGCQSLIQGECGAALVGGVNLMAHPYHQSVLSSMELLSGDEVCRPFGAKANGWVAGEGVGAVLLKRLSDAVRDGDTIHGVIVGTTISHSGRTGRYGAPNSTQQAESMRDALAQAGVPAGSISYIEAAAPGAGMADASEAAAIREVFADVTGTVHVGSIKANLGHLESASAMSQLAKVLLQMKRGQIFPTLQFQPTNPLVQWQGSALKIPYGVVEWTRGSAGPRCALINAYGATGSGGHLVVAEYLAPQLPDREAETLVVLSAATKEQLAEAALRLGAFLAQPDSASVRISDIGHTLRTGREHMKVRLAVIVHSRGELQERLKTFLAGGQTPPDLYLGEAGEASPDETRDSDLQAVAARWVVGAGPLGGVASGARRVPLPTYPFARERHWIGVLPKGQEPQGFAASAMLRSKAEAYLRGLFSEVTEIPGERIDAHAMFDAYGMTSLMVKQLNELLSRDFAGLSSALLFERKTIAELADYFMAQHAERLRALCGEVAACCAQVQPVAAVERRSTARPSAGGAEPGGRPMAIVGISGRYPKAENVAAFWENLKNGIDCITEIPAERWNDARLQGEAGKHSRWGGFIDDIDEFDPFFFKISPREAQEMDPQERLFLQVVWHLFEDAGCAPSRLSRETRDRMGVFVGVMYGEYQLHSRWDEKEGLPVSSLYGSIANRVSYTLDFHGPSMAVDTLCSSSLTALHLAVQSLQAGECDAAVVGGVNLSIHPNKYLLHARAAMSSSDGRCRSFGKGGDGFVPGEGVGAILIKPLEQAVAEGDQVYGIVRATAINHDGRTHGYTVPNPNAQAAMISEAIRRAGVNPRLISYVEAHGTGTALGDPIEIAGLSQAFGELTADKQYCALGSVKSNIGHLEAAAGIAGLTKVLLQMKHGQLAPSLHSRELNPAIRLETTPFFVPQTLTEWKRPTVERDGAAQASPRFACVSSFGAGGSNAHVVVEEYDGAEPPAADGAGEPQLIVLSAKDPERLRAVVARLREFVVSKPACRLADLAFTLQVGREVLEERLAFAASSFAELEERLKAILEGREDSHPLYRGRTDRQHAVVGVLLGDEDLQQSINAWIDKRKFDRILQAWVEGAAVDWKRLHGGVAPRKVSLPAYPFACERYWVPQRLDQPERVASASSGLHPLLHQNTSDLWELRFSSTFDGGEFFLNDHRLHGERVLPAAACLELARAAVEQATGGRVGLIHLRNVAWVQPFTVSGAGRTIHAGLQVEEGGAVRFEIYAGAPSAPRIVISQGSASFSQPAEPPKLDLKSLVDRCQRTDLSPAQCYAAFRSFGLEHGAAFRSLREIRQDGNAVLAKVAIPPAAAATRGAFWLHPALLDGMFQATIALGAPELSANAGLPYALEELTCYGPGEEEMWAYVRPADPQGPKLDLDLCNASGTVCVRIKGFSTRALETESRASVVLSRPVLRDAGIDKHRPTSAWGRRYVVTCGVELPAAEAAGLEGATWISLETGAGDPDARFESAAVQTFELIKRVLSEKSSGEILFQVLILSDGEARLYRALSGLLRTAHQENPAFRGQLIELDAEVETERMVGILAENGLHPEDDHIAYAGGRRRLMSWEPLLAAEPVDNGPWKTQGVYLITGGAGGLGLLFAGEIARRAKSCVVILAGRSALSPETEARLRALERPGTTILYRQVDVTETAAVQALVQQILKTHGALNGILHAAGVLRDNFILKKSSDELREVLAPKVRGTVCLDEATRSVDLDFFVLFSSTAGVSGNAGQADYAVANAFLDAFAEHRNTLLREGKRKGHTVAINWPLWKDGGMKVEARMLHLLAANGGLAVLETSAGLEGFGRALASKFSQVMVQPGSQQPLCCSPAGSESCALAGSAPAATAGPEQGGPLTERALRFFRGLLASTVQCPLERIKVDEPFDSYGIDSVMVMQMTTELEKSFGSLPKTLFFEYHTVRSLTGHFLQTRSEALARLLGESPPATPSVAAENPPARGWNRPESRPAGRAAEPTPGPADALDIAIIGLAGRYPQAKDLETFWHNLSQGRDCITDIPLERWDWKQFFDPERKRPGAHYGKRGGFIDEVDAFDPLFFNIAPRDARYMDPQERLFLETTWAALEDAGYRPRDLRGSPGPYLPSQVGVYAGVMYSEYQLFAHEQTLAGNPTPAGNIYASIANHVSYFLDLHGPSMTVDTMCSSSLTCIHLACQDLKSRTTDLALAGGVNVTIHPNKFLLLSEGQFISARGCCASFGQGGDGYVPGEGVGVVVLKRLADAIRDGDHIYGVIKGSAVNHGGKTNGFTVPNPEAQQEVITRALKMSGIEPSGISYVEAHSTGTPLGDPIEISGLSKAFKGRPREAGPCFLGSVKSNIGHCEAAAGIAGLTKVLLQMRHGQIAPSLHSEVLNPHMGLDQTPFQVNQALRRWERPVVEGRPQPYAAGISGFGAGGSNAHLIVEEYVAAPEPFAELNRPFVIVLSARNEKRLMERAARLQRFLKASPAVSLAELAYTLQVGREPMAERLGFIVRSTEELLELLDQVLRGIAGLKIRRGRVTDASAETLRTLAEDEDADLAAAIERWVSKGKLEKLLEFWVNGLDLDWRMLYGAARPRRMSLPTYPFARDRYWLPGKRAMAASEAADPRLASAETSRPEWLALAEEWVAEPLPEALDWKSRLREQRSKRVALLVSDEAEGQELARLIQQSESEAGASPGVRLEIVLQKDLAAWRVDQPPEVILLAAPFGGDAETDRRHVSTLFHLSQKLMREAWKSLIRLYHIHDYSEAQPRLRLEALGGLLRSAMLENERHIWTCIGVRNCANVDARNQVLLREWLTDGGAERFSAIRHQGAERRRQRLTERSVGPGAEPIFRRNGAYLVAGGLGPVGELLCRELAGRYGARLVILSRGEPDEHRQSQCRRLEALGARVSYYQVDIADRPALAAVWPKVKAEAGAIHGVIHLARLVEDSLLLSKTWEGFERVIQAKVDGTLNLDELTAAEPLDFFLLFSSMAAFGMRGSADYGYSSAFQNAFAEHRARLAAAGTRSGRTVACGWGAWSVDKYFSEVRNGQLHEAGFTLIDMEQAFPWIESRCWSGEPFLGLMLVHDGAKARSELGLKDPPENSDPISVDLAGQIETWEQRQRGGGQITAAEVSRVLRADQVSRLSEALTNRLHALLIGSGNGNGRAEPVAEPAAGADDRDLTEIIQRCLADILDLAEVEESKPFPEYGMNSISGMRFALLLEKRLKRPVLPQAVTEHPTVRALAAHLASAVDSSSTGAEGRAGEADH